MPYRLIGGPRPVPHRARDHQAGHQDPAVLGGRRSRGLPQVRQSRVYTTVYIYIILA